MVMRCRERDSNPHDRSHPILSRARLTSSAIPAVCTVRADEAGRAFRLLVSRRRSDKCSWHFSSCSSCSGSSASAGRSTRSAAGSGATSCGLAFIVAAVATGGSLFYSEIERFQPCELCWYQRLCMYPLSITLLLIALVRSEPRGALRAAARGCRRRRLDLPHAHPVRRDQGTVGLLRVQPSAAASSTGSPSRPRTRRSATSPSRRSRSRPSSFSLDSWSLQAQGPPRTRLLFRPMPSGKKARQQRQAAVAAPPPVRSTGGAGARARRHRRSLGSPAA